MFIVGTSKYVYEHEYFQFTYFFLAYFNFKNSFRRSSWKIKKFMFDDEMVHLNMNCKKTLEYKY